MKRLLAAGALLALLGAGAYGLTASSGPADRVARGGGPHAGHQVAAGGAAPHAGHQMPAVAAATPAATAEPEDAAEPDDAGAVPTSVVLSPEQQVMAHITTVKTTRERLAEEIRAAGTVGYDERLLSHVTARFAGRIERMRVSAPGDSVRRGQIVAEIYSPDLVAAQQELQVAREAVSRLGGSSYPDAAQGVAELLAAARRKLRLWDLSEAQIAAMERADKPLDVVGVPAAAAGVVVARRAEPGQYVEAGAPLLDLADLSAVWVVVDVHEADLGKIRVGRTARVQAAAFPGRTWRGRVAEILPALAAETRTARLRLEIPNPDRRLRPEMYVEAAIQADVVTALAVPASAVLDTGTRRVVWVKTDEETFEPRDVSLGNRVKDRYPVLAGLAAGDEVASSGGFLLDASAQLQAD